MPERFVCTLLFLSFSLTQSIQEDDDNIKPVGVLGLDLSTSKRYQPKFYTVRPAPAALSRAVQTNNMNNVTPATTSRIKVASVTGRVARCVMARRTVAQIIFGIERCSILCDFDAHQRRATNSQV